MVDQHQVLQNLITHIFPEDSSNFVLNCVLKMFTDPQMLDSIAKFLTLSNKKLYSGQNAWLFHYQLSKAIDKKDTRCLEILVSEGFNMYPITENHLLSKKDKSELSRLLQCDYVYTLNLFTLCDLTNTLNREIFGCMSITDKNTTTNIISKGVEITLSEFKITQINPGEYSNIQNGDDITMDFRDIIIQIAEDKIDNLSDIATNALHVKFKKEVACYYYTMDIIKSRNKLS